MNRDIALRSGVPDVINATRGWHRAPPVLAAALLASGCAGQGWSQSKPVAEFPSQAALAAIESRPAPLPKVEAAEVPSEGWTVTLPDAPPGPAAWAPSDPWGKAVVAALARAGKRPRMTAALSCVAGEVARFALASDKPPPEGLRDFVLAACGALAIDVGTTSVMTEVPEGTSDEAVAAGAERSRAAIEQYVVKPLPASATEVGFALRRDGKRVLGVLIYAQPRADIEPFSPVPSEIGEVQIAGLIKDGVDFVAGYANHGRHGVVPCFVDPTVPRPRFRITCQMDPADETAWIELLYAQPRRVLANVFLRVLTRRASARELRYQAPRPAADAAPVTSAAEFSQQAVALLNRVRAEAQLPPVRLHAAQSATAARVARQYFAATLGDGKGEEADTIALGLMAGWQVGGMIRDGNFVSTVVPQSRDPATWLHSTLERPMGRSTLLAENIEEVALGPVLLEQPQGTAAVVVGYRFHHGRDHTADIHRLLFRALAARRARKLEPLKRLGGMDKVLRDELARVNEGKVAPMDALHAALEVGVSRFGASMQGYVVEATSLDALQIPEDILAQPTLHLEIGVTHHKPPGAAWAQLVIVVVYVDYGNNRRT
jgi:hypothetical protein